MTLGRELEADTLTPDGFAHGFVLFAASVPHEPQPRAIRLDVLDEFRMLLLKLGQDFRGGFNDGWGFHF